MRLSVIMILGVSLFVLGLLSASSAASGTPIYGKMGDEVVFKPNVTGITVTEISWKHGSNLAMEWTDGIITGYREFEVRGKLNVTTGEMTIINLNLNDSGKYIPEINNIVRNSFELVVLGILTSCNEEKTVCNLTCAGDTADAGHVTYKWKLDDTFSSPSSINTFTVTQEKDSDIKKVTCELQNRFGKQSSNTIDNPVISNVEPTVSPEAGGLKINTAVTVFIVLLTSVVLLSLIHRWKAGTWFYNKASMPWEADFWRKECERREPVESNGTAAPPEKRQTDEETQLTSV